MRRILISATAVVVFAGIGAIAASLSQPPGQTARPGELTKGEVWVLNRSSEPVSTVLEAANLEKPMSVAIANGDPAMPAVPPVAVRPVRSIWEYQRVAVKPTDEGIAALSALGAQGWEATGVAWPAADGSSILLMKRAH
jgi:hypothetical protein